MKGMRNLIFLLPRGIRMMIPDIIIIIIIIIICISFLFIFGELVGGVHRQGCYRRQPPPPK